VPDKFCGQDQWKGDLKAFAKLVSEEKQTEVQRLIALVRAQQITIDKLEAALAQPAVKEPVAFPRQAGDSTWIIDTAFIWRVKHTIDPDTPYDWTPSEEQIETVLLALEKIPSPLYTTPPQRTWVGLDDEEIRKARHHMVEGAYHYSFKQGAKWAEAKLKEKNT
jgi:hypothetical protein